MDFDKQKVYGDTSITDGLVIIGAVFSWVYYLWGGSIVTANDEHKWFDTWASERITGRIRIHMIRSPDFISVI